MHHAFLYISLSSLHGYDVKMTIFTFCEGLEHKTTTFFLFSWPSVSLLEFNSRKNCQYLTNWTRWNKRGKFWSSATSLLNWRFRCLRRRCCTLLWLRGWALIRAWVAPFTCLSRAASRDLTLKYSWAGLFEAGLWGLKKQIHFNSLCPQFDDWIL